MMEVHVPLIPAQGNWLYSNGRLHGPDGTSGTIVVMPPDGVFLQTLRIKGFLNASDSVNVMLYRTPKQAFGALASVDPIVTQTITSPPGGVVDQSIPLGATGKNVVDNSVYNYSIVPSTHTTGPDAFAFISEIALLY